MAYLRAPVFETRMTALAAAAPALCTKTAFQFPTISQPGLPGHGPTTYSFITIANGSAPGRKTVLIVAGMHAREWAQPDATLKFAEKLISVYRRGGPFSIPAYTSKTGTFGPLEISETTIRRMVDELTIIIVPLANPDGRIFSQAARANRGWRKNRAPRAVPNDKNTVGVDLNRHFDIAWDYELYFDLNFVRSPLRSGSKVATEDSFIGLAAAGPGIQPEVRNLVWLLNNRPITFCIDLHAFKPAIMYPWGIEKNGDQPAQNFRDTSLNRTRDGHLLDAYSEYFPDTPPVRLLRRHETIAQSMADAIWAATGRTYPVGPIATTIYCATGSLTDYMFSRQFTIAGSPPLYSFAVEFGDSADNFQPHPTRAHRYPKIEREVHAALLHYLVGAL